jgi:phage/plasmid-associated DNA primase
MQNTLRKENTEQESSGFVVDNDRRAVWCLRKIKHLKQKQQKNEKLAEAEIEDIQKEIDEVQEWLDKENEKYQNSIDYFESLLYFYTLELRKEDPELKTHKLPFGKLQFRSKRPKWNYDNSKLLDFVSTNYREFVKVKESVDKRKLKQMTEVVGNKVVVKNTGEIVEGVEVVERNEKFQVKVDV